LPAALVTAGTNRPCRVIRCPTGDWLRLRCPGWSCSPKSVRSSSACERGSLPTERP
jgi:hypothetical protein